MRNALPPVRFALVALLATALSLQARLLPRTNPEEVGLSQERLARLTAALQEYADTASVVSLQPSL